MLNSHFPGPGLLMLAQPSSGKSDVSTSGWPGLPPPAPPSPPPLLAMCITVWARWGIPAATSPPLPTVSKPCLICLIPGQCCEPSVALPQHARKVPYVHIWSNGLKNGVGHRGLECRAQQLKF